MTKMNINAAKINQNPMLLKWYRLFRFELKHSPLAAWRMAKDCVA
jgi:hypothetical protein